MNKDNKDNEETFDPFEGPINVNSNITPITKRIVRDVTPLRWNEMSVGELYDQQMILFERLDLAHRLENQVLIRELQKGLNRLERVIQSKQKKNKDNILI